MAEFKPRTRAQVILEMAKLAKKLDSEDSFVSAANAIEYTNNNHGYVQLAHELHADACALHATVKNDLQHMVAQKIVAKMQKREYAQQKSLIQEALVNVEPDVFDKRQEEIEAKRLVDFADGLRVRTISRGHGLTNIRHYIGMTE